MEESQDPYGMVHPHLAAYCRFFKSTAKMDPLERAAFLGNDREMEVAHSAPATGDETEEVGEKGYGILCFVWYLEIIDN
ncbi:ubiquitin carboxyl-terminal hydrolase 3-like isoform X4 [Euphorbia lathyris]|uniref:ubiquitin carboxyl-terminal hydrolase 3-like isoform X4 n=1 Tax=Euphorbia lathyris TaxID=212925 RepID=UPI003313359F